MRRKGLVRQISAEPGKIEKVSYSTQLIADLKALAEECGISTSYTAADGQHTEVSIRTLIALLAAMGIHLGVTPDEAEEATGDPEGLAAEIAAARENLKNEHWRAMLPPIVVSTQGRYREVLVHVPDGSEISIHVELIGGDCDGDMRPLAQVEHNVGTRTVDGVVMGEAAFAVPEDLPLGWHRIVARSGELRAECELAVTPRRLSTADRFVQNPVSGVMAQLYSVRSHRSWGMGDFTTLGDLAAVCARDADADFLLINPLHAAEPLPPVEDSPYLPTTRRYTNPIYIRIESIPELPYLDADELIELQKIADEFRATNLTADEIDRNPIYAAKLAVLHALHRVEKSPMRQDAFDRFKEEEGQGLIDYATWCAERELLAEGLNHHANEADERAELIDFHCWLQFICDEQLEAAQRAAKEAGMSIGIMADLAVGVHPGGADAHNLRDALAMDASVGAPPDGYNQNGQDWSQPPWNPVEMAKLAYRPWRDMLRTVLRHSGGIRVDHILGMFRLWWMPRMESPLNGAYVRYDHEAFIGILALEAELVGAVVIGEDLGTFEPWVQQYLEERGIMGVSILWFESQGDYPKPPEAYRRLCLSSVTTHDLPPTAGYLAGEHIRLRDALGVLVNSAAEEDEKDMEWIRKVLAAAAERGYFAGTELEFTDFTTVKREELTDVAALTEGLHRYVSATPSALTCTSLVDMVGDRRIQNQPGTNKSMYPNWCIPLTDADGKSVLVNELAELETFQKVAGASRR